MSETNAKTIFRNPGLLETGEVRYVNVYRNVAEPYGYAWRSRRFAEEYSAPHRRRVRSCDKPIYRIVVRIK